jgi:hypothetical protein
MLMQTYKIFAKHNYIFFLQAGFFVFVNLQYFNFKDENDCTKIFKFCISFKQFFSCCAKAKKEL